MTTFILSKEGDDGRVILDEKSHGIEIGMIEADAEMRNGKIVRSAWCVARAKINESKFFRIENEGYFARETKEVAQ